MAEDMKVKMTEEINKHKKPKNPLVESITVDIFGINTKEYQYGQMGDVFWRTKRIEKLSVNEKQKYEEYLKERLEWIKLKREEKKKQKIMKSEKIQRRIKKAIEINTQRIKRKIDREISKEAKIGLIENTRKINKIARIEAKRLRTEKELEEVESKLKDLKTQS